MPVRVHRAPLRPRRTGHSLFLRPSAAQSAIITLSGWRADLSQQLLVDIQVDPAPLVVIPAVQAPP